MNEDRSTKYHRLRRRAELIGTVIAGALLLGLSLSGAAFKLREFASMAANAFPSGLEDSATVAAFTVALLVLLQLVEFPFALYQGFLLEHRYGLSTQTFGKWFGDQAKGFIVGSTLAVIAASVVFATLRNWPDQWWLISAGVFAIAVIGLAQIAPVVLLPIFYSFKPLERPELVARLMALAKKAHTNIAGVFEWVLSDHTRKANAALAGLGRTRRILLSDTLLSDYTEDEIEVILAHELAHHVHKDLWRGIAMQAVVLLGGFFVVNWVLRASAEPLSLRGIDDPAAMPLLLFAGGLWSFASLPFVNALSRAHERAADRYALETTQNVDAFVSAMKRLSQQNLAEEYPSTLVRWLFYSHPPIRERIEAARAFSKKADNAA